MVTPADMPRFDQRTLLLYFDTEATRLPRATGSVAQDDVTEALRRFVEPEGFTTAAVHLAHERLVVLCGAPGTGKRSSALSLLREVTDEAFYMLSPQIPLTDLVDHDYNTGCGYLLLDRVADQDTRESDLDWLLVRHRLAARQAYLVVTTAVPPPVSHFRWHPPRAERVLRAHGAHEWPEEHTPTLRDALRAANRVSDVVALARRLKAGEPPPVAINHVDAMMRTRIDGWLRTAPQEHVLEVTTLAFTVGVDEQHFTTALTLLREHLGATPAPAGENPLITTTGPRPTFTRPGSQQHVLSALWHQMDPHFWSAIHDWLDTLVRQPPYEQRLPTGLAKLAAVTLDEVLPTLDRWALGECGAPGQRATIHTLWLMAHEDSLAPAALRTATKWITQEHPARRWVAAMTFSGGLGVRYPHEAVDLLWRLCARTHTATRDVETVFGELFSTLVRESTDGDLVLTTLANRCAAHPLVAARTALAVLSVKDPLTNRMAVLNYLTQSPERTDTVASLLAKVLVKRPLRRRALHALQAALEEKHPKGLPQTLGKALATHLDPDEREALARDLPQTTGVTALLAALRT